MINDLSNSKYWIFIAQVFTSGYSINFDFTKYAEILILGIDNNDQNRKRNSMIVPSSIVKDKSMYMSDTNDSDEYYAICKGNGSDSISIEFGKYAGLYIYAR